jgi:hypothetical protein
VARQRLITVLRPLPVGTPVALFTLFQTLDLVQTFTLDPNEAVTKAISLSPTISPLLTTEPDRQRELGDIAYLNSNSGGPAGSSGLAIGYEGIEAQRIAARTGFTLRAFDALARSLAGLPGRKNVIFGFPAVFHCSLRRRFLLDPIVGEIRAVF